MIRFRVWANARPMGWFGHAAGEFFFEYDAQWLAQPGAYLLAPQFPLTVQPARGALVRSFFENLLPEGEVFDDVLAALQLRGASTLDVLGRLGKELPGVLSLLPEGAVALVPQNYRELPLAELSQRLAGRAANLIGNADAHAKNLSLLVDDQGYRLAPFYDLLCVRAYGDEGLALFIGDDETFDAVGAHSWEALCADCGFGFLPTLAEFRRMALALLPAWRKVQDSVAKEKGVTETERAMLARMATIFERHVDQALSMTALPVAL